MAGDKMDVRFLALYTASVAMAAIADGSAGSNRPWLVAVLEAAPMAVLGGGVLTRGAGGGTRRAGRHTFGFAMVLAVAGLIATGGRHPSEAPLALGTMVGVSLVLLAAYLRALVHRERRPSIGGIVLSLSPMAVIAGLCVADALNRGGRSGKACGVDACAWDGLAIAFDLLVAFECLMLCLVVAAFRVGAPAGLGILLAAVGLHLVVAAAPFWSRFEGVAGVMLLCGGFLLAARPWLVDGRTRTPAPARQSSSGS